MIPATATRFTDENLDPNDVLDFYIFLTRGAEGDGKAFLYESEVVTSFSLILGAESVAAGLEIASSGRFKLRLGNDVVAFGLSVASSLRTSSIFNGGLDLPLELKVTTDQERTRRRTAVIRVVNQ